LPLGQDLYFGKEDLGVGLGDAQSADWKVAVLDHEEGGLRQTRKNATSFGVAGRVRNSK